MNNQTSLQGEHATISSFRIIILFYVLSLLVAHFSLWVILSPDLSQSLSQGQHYIWRE